MITIIMWISIAILATLLTGLFAGMETGVYVINKIRLDLHAAAGIPSAKRISKLVKKPENLLVVLLIGTNIWTYLATFAISALYLYTGFEHQTEWYTIATATPLLFIFGESLPKNIFQQFGETITHKCSYILLASSWIFNACGLAPLVRFFSWFIMKLTPAGRRPTKPFTRLTAHHVVAEGAACGVITHFQSVMAERAMKIKQVTIAQVMTPMAEVVTVPADISRENLTQIMRQYNYSQVPVKGAGGDIIAILNIFDMLTGNDESIMNVACKPVTIDSTTSVTDALFIMNVTNTLMTIATENEIPVGIITIKDLAEEIVGDLEEW